MHPKITFECIHQGKMNGIYDPDVVTGAYGDGSASDELFWAATSQYMASYPGNRDVYLTDVIENMPEEFTLMSWGNVAALGVFNWIESELHHRKFGEFYSGLPDPYAKQKEEIKGKCVKMLLEYCDKAIEAVEGSSMLMVGWSPSSLSLPRCSRARW